MEYFEKLLEGPIAGGKLKEDCSVLWVSPNFGATNSSGFTALPGGARGGGNGTFNDLGLNADFRSSTNDGTSNSWNFFMIQTRQDADLGSYNIAYGINVRCLKNN